MAFNMATQLNMSGLEILNALAQNLATAPTHAAGRFYYDTVLEALRVSDGSSWITLGSGGGAVDSVNSQTGAVTLTQDDVGDGSTYKRYSATEKTKLSGVATGATANDTDANLKARANHTGTQASSTISDFTSAVNTLVSAAIASLINSAPSSLDTLKELSDALGGDANFAASMATALGLKNDTYTTTVGDGVSTSIDVVHNFGTRAVTWAMYETGSPYAAFYPEVRHKDTNTLTFIFAVAPTSAKYTVVVQG